MVFLPTVKLLRAIVSGMFSVWTKEKSYVDSSHKTTCGDFKQHMAIWMTKTNDYSVAVMLLWQQKVVHIHLITNVHE